MTGRLPIRNGMCSDVDRVIRENSLYGLPHEEITIAEALKEKGYATEMVGKWHLGHHDPEYLPIHNGFDSFFGLPYSNDMDRTIGGDFREPYYDPKLEYWNVALMRDDEIIERPADQTTLTRRYTEEAVQFIHAHKDGPFFLYFAHTFPHLPLFRSEDFVGVSDGGIHGDVVEEIDWSVGQVLQALRDEGVAENTLVFFTSDNGPWIWFGDIAGTAAPFYGGKGMTWEGGVRVPGIAWWPGTIEEGSEATAVTSTLDLFPTALELAGAQMPTDREYDGHSLVPLLKGEEATDDERVFFYYRGTKIYAARKGPWKAHFITEWAYEYVTDDQFKSVHEPPLLFNLDEDPSEQNDVSSEHPEIISEIRAAVADHQSTIVPYPDQLAPKE